MPLAQTSEPGRGTTASPRHPWPIHPTHHIHLSGVGTPAGRIEPPYV